MYKADTHTFSALSMVLKFHGEVIRKKGPKRFMGRGGGGGCDEKKVEKH